ncbi:MAG: hypothetical protein ACW987_04855, partial [Candidatus Thorarchaeota archaeon]
MSVSAEYDPNNRKNVALFRLSGKSSANPMSENFLEHARAHHFIPVNIQEAWQAYTADNEVSSPPTRAEFNGFVDSIQDTEIQEQLPVGFDAGSALSYVQQQLLDMSDADRNYLLSSGRLDAPDGSVSIMLPKNDRAT